MIDRQTEPQKSVRPIMRDKKGQRPGAAITPGEAPAPAQASVLPAKPAEPPQPTHDEYNIPLSLPPSKRAILKAFMQGFLLEDQPMKLIDMIIITHKPHQ